MGTVLRPLSRLAALLAITMLTAPAYSQSLHQELPDSFVVKPEPVRFFPDGNSMLFSMFSLEKPETETAKNDGFTAIGPYYWRKRDLNDYIALAKSADLPLVYTIGPKLNFKDNSIPDLSAANKLLANEVAAASQRPEIAVWALANEELRYWRKTEMRWLEMAAKTIRKNDPWQRPVLMYEPNHRNAEALSKTSIHLDYVTKSAYANYVEMKYNRSWVKHSIIQSVTAAKSTGTTPLAVLWMARDQKSNSDIEDIHAWARHDVYLSLITGARGILIFSGWNKRPGFEKHYNNFYDGYASAAKELNGESGLSKVFLYGEKQNGLSISVVDGPESQHFKYLEEALAYPTISFEHLLLDGQHYLFVVNSANEPVSIAIEGIPAAEPISNAFNSLRIRMDSQTRLKKYEVIALTWPHSGKEE